MLTLRSSSRLGQRFISSSSWFVDSEPRRAIPPHLKSPLEVPENAPDHLKPPHSQLSNSPHLDLSTLVVCPPISFQPGPPLPHSLPKGRRQRGGSYAGEGIPESLGSIWSWIIMAQVCDPVLGH